MWPDLREEVELQMAMLREEVGSVAPLRKKVAVLPPDLVERMALGAFLHSFYNGVENALKRIAIHTDGGPPRGEAWHQQLLESMTRSGVARPAAISAALGKALGEYMDFRHLFRHIYASRLDWSRMGGLVAACEDTLDRLETELRAFLDAGEGRGD